MSRGGKRSKARSQTTHALRRAYERYDVELSKADLVAMRKMIQGFPIFDSSTTQFIDKQSNRVSRWKVLYNGVWYYAVFDKHRGTIVTLLTREMVEESAALPAVSSR